MQYEIWNMQNSYSRTQSVILERAKWKYLHLLYYALSLCVHQQSTINNLCKLWLGFISTVQSIPMENKIIQNTEKSHCLSLSRSTTNDQRPTHNIQHWAFIFNNLGPPSSPSFSILSACSMLFLYKWWHYDFVYYSSPKSRVQSLQSTVYSFFT